MSATLRHRHELDGRFVLRDYFTDFSEQLWAARSANVSKKLEPLVSILGPKGSGKTTFFRWFVATQCTQRLVLYLNEPKSLSEVNVASVESLIFGLQALGHASDKNTSEASLQLLELVLAWPPVVDFAQFHWRWRNLSKHPLFGELLCQAIVVVDQLKREGDVFELFTGVKFPCFL